MPINQTLEQLLSLLRELCRLPNETEWVEFKHNNAVKVIGEHSSASDNSRLFVDRERINV
jgi:ATP-dependent DNA helicase RecG